MHDSVDFLRLQLTKHAIFRGETLIFSKKAPFCKALLGPKGTKAWNVEGQFSYDSWFS